MKADGQIASIGGRRILISGAGGFIGSRVTKLAADLGAHVTALIRPNSNPLRLLSLKEVQLLEADIQDPAGLQRAWESTRPEIVVHAAGWADWRRDPTLTFEMMTVHALGTARVLEISRSTGVERVVVLGSAGEYGGGPVPFEEAGPALPLDPYSVSKLAATQLALTYHRAFGLSCTVVRPFVVYGPGEASQRLFPTVFEAARCEGGERDFTTGDQVRDFVYVDDVAEGVLRAAIAASASGQILNLGTGLGVRVRDAVLLANQISGNRIVPRFGALPGRIGEVPVYIASTRLCQTILSWSPTTSLEAGLTRMWTAMTSREDLPA